MTTFFKGPLFAFLVLAVVGLGDVYAGFYDEVKVRAVQGDPEAQDLLSYMYETGRGVPRDLEQARRWAMLAERGGSNGKRVTPQRPPVGTPSYSFRSIPRRPAVNASSYQSVRMVPRRPGSIASIPEVRARPRRPSRGAVIDFARAGLRETEFGMIDRGLRNYQRGQKWYQRVAKGGKLLVSPVTFTLKQSTRVVSKAVRKATFGGVVLY